MMLTKILIFAWTFGIINQRTTPFIIDCLTRVQKCPIGKEAWAIKNDRYRCKGTETYVCIQDSNRNLYEGCMSNFTIQANSGNCPVLIVCVKNKPYLGLKESYFPCPEEDPGCPAKSHPEYSIQELYKYPRCSGSQVFLNTSRTRQDSTTSGFNSTKDHVQGQGHTYIIVILVVIPVIIVCSMIGCFLVYKRCKGTYNGNYESVSLRPSERLESSSITSENEDVPLSPKDERGKEKEIRDLILYWNEIQTEQIQILPLDEDDTMEIDDVYTQVLLRDESDKRHSNLDDKSNIQNTTLDKIFILSEEKPARFIFMLGEAGYGKTVQCQQITRSWCQAWRNENCQDNLLGTLKIFDFLFFVKLRDTQNNYTSLIDIILEAYSRYHPSHECLNTIRTILEQGNYKSLVILDGLDEWNIPDADGLLDKGIPDCRNMCKCTILISMRSWKFIEVKQIRLHKLDKVVRLCGLDERGFESFREALLCRYLKMDKASEEFQSITSSIEGFKSTSSYAASSLLKIPLLAIFCILTFHQNVQTGNSLTTLYLSILETLLKRSKLEIRSTEFESVYPTLENYKHLKNLRNDLSHLGKIAFSGLTSENNALVFTSEDLNETFGEQLLERYLKIGLLIKAKRRGQLHERNVKISFLHKTIQEFLAAFYIWTESNIDEYFINKYVLDVEKALNFSMVLTFLSGLSSVDGCKISRQLTSLASNDEDIQSFRLSFTTDSYEKVFHLYDLQLRCYREIRGPNNIECFGEDLKLKFSFSDIILHGKDSDRQIIRETADVLLQHPHDIESLQMKFIPDDEQNGITNVELNNFLDKGTSIKAVNIDGYVDGQCRVFTHFSEKMTRLTTLGLHNIAIEGEILKDLFTKNTTRNFQALALYYIRSSDDPNVRFEYNFPSEKSKPSRRSGYERKERIRALPTSDSHNNEDSGKPLLKDILRVLPDFELLTTLHISYMESLEDRNILLVVAKELQTKGKLKNFGYRGSSIYNVADDQHDTKIIEVILTMNQLEYIFLCDIALNDKFPVFPEMLQLKKFSLQDISMDKMEWRKLVTALSDLSNKACLTDVVLTDTNIDDESLKQFEVAPGLSIKMIST